MDINAKIIMVRTIGGEFIIGYECTSLDPNKTAINNARIFNIQLTQRGAAISFIPPYPFSKTTIEELSNIELDRSVIILKVDESKMDSEIVNGYKQHVSGIDLSAAKPGLII